MDNSTKKAKINLDNINNDLDLNSNKHDSKHEKKIDNDLVKFQIFIKNFQNKTKIYNVCNNTKISELLEEICDKEGIPQNKIKITFMGRTLNKNHNIKYYNIEKDYNLYIGIKLSN